MIFAVIFAIMPVLTVVERKLLGRFQARYGPNRVGPYGLLQPAADVLKLISKEYYTPTHAVPVLWSLGPVIVIFCGVAALAIIPFGNVAGRRSASTGSTSRSASSTSSPSARSRSTAC